MRQCRRLFQYFNGETARTAEAVRPQPGRRLTAVVDDHRGDHAGGDGAEYVLAVRFAPFIAARRVAQVVLAIVDALGAAPVVVAHAFAAVPMVAGSMVLTPAGVIVGLGADRTGHANNQRRRSGGKNKNFHEFRLSKSDLGGRKTRPDKWNVPA